MKYFKDENNNVYAFEADGSQDEYIPKTLVRITEDEADALRTPPSPTTEENKAAAVNLLKDTDWVNQPDVRDPTNTPHLLNADEFDAYRLEVRRIAINPVAGNLAWPTLPAEQWSV